MSPLRRTLKNRFPRLTLKLALKSQDLGRALRWHLGSGRRTFHQKATEILSQHKWCFIVGCNNSGTSLLNHIFERSGQVSTFAYEGQRYTTALRRADRWGYERVWTEYADALRCRADEGLDRLPRLLHDWWPELPKPVKPVIIEKTPANVLRMSWLQKAFPNCCFIGVVRNGYAVAEGIRRKAGISLVRGAKHWNQVNKIMMNESQSIDHFMNLHYEDLVEASDQTATRLAEFVGLATHSFEEAMSGEFPLKTIYGNGPVSIKNMNSKALSRLTRDERQCIHAVASEMLDHFGYTCGGELPPQ